MKVKRIRWRGFFGRLTVARPFSIAYFPRQALHALLNLVRQ
jgi:hypothetical protein